MSSHWSNPLLLCGKASSQTDVLGPCWAYTKPSTGKLGMWLVAQLNVSGYAQQSWELSTGVPVHESFQSMHKKAEEALL